MPEPIGALSHVGIALEATPGIPVKPLHQLDYVSESLHGKGGPIRSRAINGTRAVKKAVMGAYNADGDIQIEVTPDKVTTLLYAALSTLATAAGTPNVHQFKTGGILRPFTTQIYRPEGAGGKYFVHPGCYISQIAFAAAIDEILMATFSLGSRSYERVYDTDQSDAAVTASALDPFVFHQGSVDISSKAGTGTVAASGTAVTGTGTLFTTEASVGDRITIAGQTRSITVIGSATGLTVDTAFSPAVSAGAYYTINRAIAGTGTISSTGAAVAGVGTAFTTQLRPGDTIISASGQARTVATITSDTVLTVTTAFSPDVTTAAFTVLNVPNLDTNNWNININTGLSFNKGIGAGRAPNRAYPGDSVVSGSFDLVFDDITQHQRWMGQASRSSGMTPGTAIQLFAVQLLFQASSTAILQIDLPRVYYTDSAPAVSGRDGVILQPLTFEALYDPTWQTDILITISNSESNASIITPGVAIA